jgi:hypothetical protein
MRLDDGQIELMDDAMVEVQRRMTTWQRWAGCVRHVGITRASAWKRQSVGCTPTAKKPPSDAKSRGECCVNQSELFVYLVDVLERLKFRTGSGVPMPASSLVSHARPTTSTWSCT